MFTKLLGRTKSVITFEILNRSVPFSTIIQQQLKYAIKVINHSIGKFHEYEL